MLWVSVDKADKPLAFVDLLPDGHIDMLFCHPHMAGQGHAAALYDRLDHSARQQGLERLSVDASAAARGFFTRQGFATAYRRVFQRNGVVLHNYRIIKKLS